MLAQLKTFLQSMITHKIGNKQLFIQHTVLSFIFIKKFFVDIKIKIQHINFLIKEKALNSLKKNIHLISSFVFLILFIVIQPYFNELCDKIDFIHYFINQFSNKIYILERPSVKIQFLGCGCD